MQRTHFIALSPFALGFAITTASAHAQTIVHVTPEPRPVADCSEADSGDRVVMADGSQVGINIPNSLNCGVGSQALAQGGTAVGPDARANGPNATALGFAAIADAPQSTAIGRGAEAAYTGSTAIGVGAQSTAENQVALGGSGTSVRVGDIAASSAAQVGAVNLVTVDANGTIGRASIGPSVINALTAAQANLAERVDTLFDLRSIDRRDASSGTAAAMAMAAAPMPSAPGKVSYAFNAATFRGREAVGGSILYRVDSTTPFAIGAAFSYAGNGNNGARVGVAGEF